ncbi:MAG: hypothetical protein JNK63_00660 [Chthonomonas sp.]|nr:hypothetical protein [Chthonomonas sp.]
MEKAKFGHLGNLGLLMGVLFGGTALALMFGGDKAMGAEMVRSWTWAWGVFMALTLGSLGMALLSYITRGAWSQSVLRLFEAGGGAKTLFIMALLFLPVAANFGVPYYKWFPLQVHDEYMVTKAQWLNPQGFGIRFGIYFLIWMYLAARLRKSSLRQDESREIREQHFRTNLASPGMVVFILSVTLAATDWFMSMDPHWFSTMYGPLFIIVSANMALALATFIVCRNAKKEPYNQIVSEDLTKDLGNLNFMMTMLWIYFSLSQFIIIWSGNLPEFTSFYYKRQVESQFLLILGAVNVVFGWLIPWTALLAPRTKRNLSLLAFTAAAIFLMRFIDLYWTIMPFMRGGQVLPIWTDLLAILSIGSFWMWMFGKTTTEAELLPAHDTRLQEALHHEHA